MNINVLRLRRHSTENIIIALSIIFSSFVGMQFLGISLNKIALLPLIIYLLMHFRKKISLNKGQKMLILFYVFSIASVISGFLIQEKIQGLQEKLGLYFAQVCLMYIPLTLLSNNLKDPIGVVKKTLIFMARVNAIWAVVQFVFWYGLHLDINNVLFNDVFNGILGKEWSVWNYEAGSLALRVAGFQNDAAFFAILLILGFCLDTSRIWKVIYIGTCVLSMSRTGILAIFIIWFMNLIKKICYGKVRIKTLTIGVFVIISAVIAIVIAYNQIPSIQFQIDYMIFRMKNISGGSDSGTIRHLNYIPTAIDVWLMNFNAFRKLFGVGPRCGGVAFSMTNYLEVSKGVAWAIECDYAELLMAQGVTGFLIYGSIYQVYKRYKFDAQIRDCMLTILIAGVMYNVLETTLLQVVIILLLPNYRKRA